MIEMSEISDTARQYCASLLDVLQAHGVKHIFLSPGSRNAPVLISASLRESLRKHIVTDERNAAFVALGMAMVSREPVALCCTSGTALYNYAPAIAEAFYQQLPLIVITADRPREWIGQDDSQTLIQPGALDNIVKRSYDIPVDSNNPDTLWMVERIANEAMILATSRQQGPIHINIQFGNNLSETATRTRRAAVVCEIKAEERIAPAQLESLAEILAGHRVLVAAGFMPPDNKLNNALAQFAKLPNVWVMAETLSNLHLPPCAYSVDTTLTAMSAAEKKEMQPDVVISIGGALVSRMLKTFIREAHPQHVWTLGDTAAGVDCFQALSAHIDVSPTTFFKAIVPAVKRANKRIEKDVDKDVDNYADKWLHIYKQAERRIIRHADYAGWSELSAFRHILDNIPQNTNLFLSNGTPVRYAQLLTNRLPHAVYGNRGVSGIEGTTATAAGVAMAYPDNTLLVTGDMSFGYAPTVMELGCLPRSFKIIVINNGGGGIFRFIRPTRDLAQREEYFCANPKVPIKGLAEAYGWSYLRAASADELGKTFDTLLKCPDNAILEICVDAEHSANVLCKLLDPKL